MLLAYLSSSYYAAYSVIHSIVCLWLLTNLSRRIKHNIRRALYADRMFYHLNPHVNGFMWKYPKRFNSFSSSNINIAFLDQAQLMFSSRGKWINWIKARSKTLFAVRIERLAPAQLFDNQITDISGKSRVNPSIWTECRLVGLSWGKGFAHIEFRINFRLELSKNRALTVTQCICVPSCEYVTLNFSGMWNEKIKKFSYWAQVTIFQNF